MQHARFRDIEMAYDVAGADGTPVLLIMGYMVRGMAWRRQVPPLAEAHRVAWFDNRHTGETKARRPRTLAGYADDAARLLDHLGWAQAHVVGISMGGMIAQHLALRHRHRLCSLTLMATHAGGRGAFLPPREGVKLFLRANRKGRGRGEATLRLLMSDRFMERADRRQVLSDLAEEMDVSSARRRLLQVGAIFLHNTRPRLAQLGDLPTLVIQPAQDRLIHPRHSEEIAARIPGARLLTVPGVGHGLLREVPELISRALLEHFAAVDAA